MHYLATLLKAFADESRLRIISLLEAGELCVCEIQPVLKLAQSTVSRHLQALEEVGVIAGRRQGTWKYYRLHPHPSPQVQALLGTVRQALETAGAGERLRSHLARLRVGSACGGRPAA
jgi:DNA-binding transcriptional ArsR family regulator